MLHDLKNMLSPKPVGRHCKSQYGPGQSMPLNQLKLLVIQSKVGIAFAILSSSTLVCLRRATSRSFSLPVCLAHSSCIVLICRNKLP